MRMLVSVRTVIEARLAADGGADFIDLKEPRDGALGALPIATVAALVRALRERGGRRLPISGTIGDLPMHDLAAIRAQVEAVAACGVDYVKVGVERDAASAVVLDALATSGQAVVPVFIADRGLDPARLAQACRLRFPAVMVDTADKAGGSVFEVLPPAELQRFVDAVRASGALVGVSGKLRREHLPALRALGCDFAGFRSAVCAGTRGDELDPERLRRLALEVQAPVTAPA